MISSTDETTQQFVPSFSPQAPATTGPGIPVTSARRVQFWEDQTHRPISYYRSPKAFDRSNKTSYRPGTWADITGEGFVNTSGATDPDRVWTPTVEGEFLWSHDRTASHWKDVRRCRKAVCRADSDTCSLAEQDQPEALDEIKRNHYGLALGRALLLREGLVGLEQTQAEWYACSASVLEPNVVPRRVFSNKVYRSA